MTTINIGKIIVNRVHRGSDTRIARNTYRYVPEERTIYRCLTNDLGKEWIDYEGNRFNGWKEHYTVQTNEELEFLKKIYIDSIGGWRNLYN